MAKTRIIKVTVAAFGLLLAALIAFYYVYSWLETEAFPDPPPNEYVIVFEEVGESIYIRARGWGLAGNHFEIVIANSPITGFEYDKERQVVYLDNTELYYKKVGIDTLEIHVGMLAEVPKEFSSKVKVKQVELSHDELRDYATNYSKYGLLKVSGYPSN